jgi:hypothetical protein
VALVIHLNLEADLAFGQIFGGYLQVFVFRAGKCQLVAASGLRFDYSKRFSQ